MPSFSSLQNTPSGPIDNFKTTLMPSNSEAPAPLSASGQTFEPSAWLSGGDTDSSALPASSQVRVEDIPTQIEQPPLPETEDEEEKSRRMVFFSRIFPLADGSELVDMPTMLEQAPSLQGTPDPGAAAAFSGTPQGGNPNFFASAPPAFDQYYAGNDPIQQEDFSQPSSQDYFSPAGDSFSPSFPPATMPYMSPYAGQISGPVPAAPGMPHPQAPVASKRFPKGCALWGAILLVPILIFVSILGLGMTTFAPVLSSSGTTDVSPGGVLHVHGHSFLANDMITLTVDNGVAVQLASSLQNTPQLAQQSSDQTLLLAMSSALPAAASTVKAASDGTFNATIMVNNNWAPGHHLIHAQESMSPRSASLAFSILNQVEILPSVTPTPRPTPSTPPTPTNAPLTPTPIVVSQLSSLSPNTLSLGMLSQGSTQTLSGQTTLKATGNAPVAWTASWNQQRNPWLLVSPTSGLISTPGSQQIAVMASAGSLQPGTYSANIAFSSAHNNQPLTLTVSFKVKSLCIQGTPGSLTFTATAGGPDPAAQMVNLNNCGGAGPWTATVSGGTNWLTVNPAAGNLTGGATQAVTVSASLANAQLAAGTYTGAILFASGSSQFQVTVAFVVQAPQSTILQVTPATINATTACQISGRNSNPSYSCTVTLSSGNTPQMLNWTSGSNLTNPQSGTHVPASVTITVPVRSCFGTTVTVTFTGPGNTASVNISC